MLDLILCIDDDPITQILNKKVVFKTTFAKEIVTAQNGKEAIHFFDSIKLKGKNSNIHPQLIFLDLNMPVMGGWEFLDCFRSPDYANFNTTTKIVILSSTIDPEDLAKARSYPMVIDFLAKPITISMLDYLSNKYY